MDSNFNSPIPRKNPGHQQIIGLLRGGVPRGGGSLIFPKVPQSSLGILRVPQLPPPLEHPGTLRNPTNKSSHRKFPSGPSNGTLRDFIAPRQMTRRNGCNGPRLLERPFPPKKHTPQSTQSVNCNTITYNDNQRQMLYPSIPRNLPR